MGWNDRLDDWSHTSVPEEAIMEGTATGILDINDDWLKKAPHELQVEAMKAWFLARYCDPAEETPYISAEGGYIFVHGGPYSPGEELGERFEGIASDKAIEELVEELQMEVGEDWAPIHWGREDYYDEVYGVEVTDPNAPIHILEKRLGEINEVLTLTGSDAATELVRKFAYSGTITALESFLWETVSYAAEHDDSVLEGIVSKTGHFKEIKTTVSDVFKNHRAIRGQVKGFLQDMVWHKWDKVAPLLVNGFGVKPPSFDALVKATVKRHDIVHRSGHTKLGEPITVTAQEINELMIEVHKFASELTEKIALRSTIDSFTKLLEAGDGEAAK